MISMCKMIPVWAKQGTATNVSSTYRQKGKDMQQGFPGKTDNVGLRIKANGFTLVELLITLAILLTVSLCFIPMLVYVAEANEANHSRLVATKLASSVIEQIRALKFDDIGNCEVTQDASGNITGKSYPYNLSGEVPRTITKKINGASFTIKTVISWYMENGIYRSDYKNVAVSVTARDSFSGKDMCYANLFTTVARNGEEVVIVGGNVQINLIDENGDPVPDVDVTLTSIDGEVEQKMTTDVGGSALFIGLPVTVSGGSYTSRTYKIGIDPVYKIISGPSTVSVEFNQTKKVDLTVKLE